MYSHGLTDEQFAKIGRIVLNWGAVDNNLGYCLNFIFGILDPNDQLDLIAILDMRKKVDLLLKAGKRKGVPREQFDLIKEISSVCRMWVEERNFIAHGLGVSSKEGYTSIMSGKKQTFYEVENLDRDAVRSEYALNLSIRLNSSLAGIAWNPYGDLPERPA